VIHVYSQIHAPYGEGHLFVSPQKYAEIQEKIRDIAKLKKKETRQIELCKLFGLDQLKFRMLEEDDNNHDWSIRLSRGANHYRTRLFTDLSFEVKSEGV